jgi:GAF domain-containing protein
MDTLEIFMSQAGMALEKALLEKRLSELQKEKK